MRIAISIVFAALAAWSLRAGEPQEPFVVHEWGVMVRSSAIVKVVPFRDIAARGAVLPARTVLGPPREHVEDLPGFVLRHGKEFQPSTQHRGWNKPILHLYGPEGLQVQVQVLTALGRPTAYWPKPKLLEETFWFMGTGVTDAVGMEWSGKLSKGQHPGTVPEMKSTHWWHQARAVPGMWFHSEGGSERFIFYEATAVQEPLTTGRVSPQTLTLSNSDKDPSGVVLVILNDGVRRYCRRIEQVPGGGSVEIRKEEALKTPSEAAETLAACRAQWESFGLTAAEAAAIVEIWKPDLLDSPGFLMISRLPAEVYGRLFPLTVTPKPDQLVRVGMVFDSLPGEEARLSWLPELDKWLARAAAELDAETFEKREQARARLARLGDLAKPFLEKVAASGSAEATGAARNLLARLKPAAYELTGHGGRGGTPGLVQRSWKDLELPPTPAKK